MIHPNGAITFNWVIPQAGGAPVANQYYVVRIRSLDGTKEFYSSARLLDSSSVTASFSELRGLDHGKTYQWFVRAYDSADNTMRQSNRLTFFYNPFKLPYHTVTVGKSGTGTGTVTSSPAGINCGSYCSDTFVAGMPVTLTATPDKGSFFTGWSGACSGTYSCTVAMNADKAVTANFILDEDGDGIEHVVDTQPYVFSNDFSDGTTHGTIKNRGDQLLIITRESNGVKIKAMPSGGSSSATVSVCGSATLTLNRGDEVVVTCGSVTINVISGTVNITFTATDNKTATTSLGANNSIVFEPTTFTFTAPSTNYVSVIVVVDNKQFSVTPGEKVKVINIDIKPDSYPNSINLGSKGKIPVAILSTKNFNAPKQDNSSSLTFGRTGNEKSLAFCNTSPEDVNKDGLGDLICHFNTQLTGFQTKDTMGILKGVTVDGTPIEGMDSVKIVP
jgi:hypothetical protein